MNRRILAVLLILGALMTSALVVNALSWNSGTVTLTCTGFVDNGVSMTGDRVNFGADRERVSIHVTDGDGTVLYDLTFQFAIGQTLALGSPSYTVLPDYNPITFTLISEAGNELPEQLVYTTTGNCPGLPTYGETPAASSAACGLALPSGSVVGEAPNGAQVYYAPGQITNITLKPGTYTVVGQDASETYYKIILACQYVWVRKDAMQPSYQAPQNGAPLPTNIVS